LPIIEKQRALALKGKVYFVQRPRPIWCLPVV